MKLYVFMAFAMIFAASFYNTNSKAEATEVPAPELHAQVQFQFSRMKDEPLVNGGLKNLRIDTDGELKCGMHLGFTLDECGQRNTKECTKITGTVRCSYKTRKGSKEFTNDIQWAVVESDGQATPTKTPTYNMAGCARHIETQDHLNGCLARELKDGNLTMHIEALSGEMKVTGGITGCAGCQFSNAE